MLSDEWLSRYGLLENFNACVMRTRTGTGTWTTGVTVIMDCNQDYILITSDYNKIDFDWFYAKC